MSKIIVGRRITYLEIFEIDTDKIPSMRDDLNLCQRVLYAADPDLTQRLKTGKKESGIKLLTRIQEEICDNPVYPLPDYPIGLDEACVLEEQK